MGPLGNLLSRRDALGTFAAATAGLLFHPAASIDERCGSATWGELAGTLPLSRPDGVVQSFGVKQGGPGLDARQVTDLSALQPDLLVTPNRLACIRTEAPPVPPRLDQWTIMIAGDAGDLGGLTIAGLTRRAKPMGAHLLECSGNNNPANFGLMSVCEYDGVPLADVVARLRPSGAAWGAVVSGMDPTAPSTGSVAGAGWAFPLAALAQLGAFLALRMNGAPLPLDHGAPIRLVVPGWYGCSWIKWVNQIRLVPMTDGATSQMREFAGRTHQTRAHALARDYAPAEIDAAATAVRVEKRRGGTSGLEYRVVGIVWGGRKPIDQLAIRFGPNDAWRSFPVCPAPKTHRTWSLWEYRWKPTAPAIYDIALKVPDPQIPQRRLDSGYYVRQVRIDEI